MKTNISVGDTVVITKNVKVFDNIHDTSYSVGWCGIVIAFINKREVEVKFYNFTIIVPLTHIEKFNPNKYINVLY